MENEVKEKDALRLNSKEFGRRLRSLRRQQELTQAEMGRLLSCKQATISAYEDGRIVPSLQVVYKVASLFSIDLNWFINGSEPSTDNNAGLVVREHVKYYTPVTQADPTPESGVSEKLQSELARTQQMMIELQKDYIKLLQKS